MCKIGISWASQLRCQSLLHVRLHEGEETEASLTPQNPALTRERHLNPGFQRCLHATSWTKERVWESIVLSSILYRSCEYVGSRLSSDQDSSVFRKTYQIYKEPSPHVQIVLRRLQASPRSVSLKTCTRMKPHPLLLRPGSLSHDFKPTAR